MRNAMCPRPRSGTRPIELGRAVSLAAEFSLRDLIVDLKQLADSAGADWGKRNFEVVLSAEVVKGVQGKPKVEAKAFW